MKPHARPRAARERADSRERLEKSYSAIVGLETQISAFQKRSHVHRGAATTAQSMQMRTMLEALNAERQHCRDLESMCLLPSTPRRTPPSACAWICQTNHAKMLGFDRSAEGGVGEPGTDSGIVHRNESIETCAPPSSPQPLSGEAKTSRPDRSPAARQGTARPLQFYEAETQTADESRMHIGEQGRDDDRDFIMDMARHDVLLEEDALRKKLSETTTIKTAVEDALIEKQSQLITLLHLELEKLPDQGLLQTKSACEDELIGKQQKLIESLLVEQESSAIAARLQEQLDEMEELVSHAARNEEESSSSESSSHLQTTQSPGHDLAMSWFAQRRSSISSRCMRSTRGSRRCAVSDTCQESHSAAAESPIAYSKRSSPVESGTQCDLMEETRQIQKQAEDERFRQRCSEIRTMLEEENVRLRHAGRLCEAALEVEQQRRNMMEKCVQAVSQTLKAKCHSDACDQQRERQDHKQREDELKTELDQRRAQAEQAAQQREILENALDAAVSLNAEYEAKNAQHEAALSRLQSALDKEEETVRVLIELNEALNEAEAAREEAMRWRVEAVGDLGEAGGGRGPGEAAGELPQEEEGINQEEEQSGPSRGDPEDIASQEQVEALGLEEAEGLEEVCRQESLTDERKKAGEELELKRTAYRLWAASIRSVDKDQLNHHQPPRRLPPMSPKQVKTFHTQLPTRTRRRIETGSSRLAGAGLLKPPGQGPGQSASREECGEATDVERTPQCAPSRCRLM